MDCRNPAKIYLTRTEFIGLASSHCVLAGTEPSAGRAPFFNRKLGLHALILLRHEQHATVRQRLAVSISSCAAHRGDERCSLVCAYAPALAVVLV